MGTDGLSTRASVATVLNTYPCVSSCSQVNPKEHSWGLLGPGEGHQQQPWRQYKGMTHQAPCIPQEYCLPKSCRLYFVKYFSKKFLCENFWKTNVKAHPEPFRPGPHLHQTRLQHSTYINRKYSSGDRTMFDSILTVFVVIYVIVQWTYCSKRTTSMNDLTTLEYWWIGVSRQILFDEYYDIRWYEISWTILSYGPVLS